MTALAAALLVPKSAAPRIRAQAKCLREELETKHGRTLVSEELEAVPKRSWSDLAHDVVNRIAQED